MIYVENMRIYKGHGIYIGRPSILGNPFTHIPVRTIAKFIVKTREESIEKYKEYFMQMLVSDEAFKKEINKLQLLHKEGKDIHLICWCKPLSCHGDIIKEFIDNGETNV